MTPDADPRPLAATHSDEPAATESARDVPGAQNGSQGVRPELVEARLTVLRHTSMTSARCNEVLDDIEAAVRAKVAGEIEAACEREAPMHPTFPPRDGGLRAAAYRRGMSYAADIARGGQDGGR